MTIQTLSAAEFSGAIYGALSKRQATAEARRRGWSGDDARTGKSALCDWLAQNVPAAEREALLNGGAAQVVGGEATAAQEQPAAPVPELPAGKTARFAGRCKACGETIAEGAAIAKNAAGYWVHSACATRAQQPEQAPSAQQAAMKQATAALQSASNADQVAQAIAAALRSLNVAAPLDEAAVRRIVRDEGGAALDWDRVKGAIERAVSAMVSRPVEIHLPDQAPVKVQGRTHPLFEKVLRLVRAGVNVLLVGPAGCGKSHLAHQVADALGRKFGTLHCSAGVSESAATGWLLPVGEGGAFAFKPAQFATLYSEGNSVFLLDEIDAADPNMLTVLNGALANGALHIPQCVDRPEWKRGADAAIMAAANTFGTGADALYVGRNQLDAATLDRFYVVQMDYDAALEADIAGMDAPKVAAWKPADEKRTAEETAAEVRAFGEWVRALRERATAAKLRRVVSTRTMQKGAAAIRAGVPTAEVKADMLAGWTRDERNKVGE